MRDHDFRWTWIARFFMFFGYTAISNFVLYILQSHIQPALSASEANETFAGLSSAALPGQLIMMLIAGRLSDMVGRRKPFVIGASAFIAAIMLIPILGARPAGLAFYVFCILLAASHGMYMAVDVALFIDVLPDKKTASYSSLSIMSIVAVAVSAAAIIPLRKVK